MFVPNLNGVYRNGRTLLLSDNEMLAIHSYIEHKLLLKKAAKKLKQHAVNIDIDFENGQQFTANQSFHPWTRYLFGDNITPENVEKFGLIQLFEHLKNDDTAENETWSQACDQVIPPRITAKLADAITPQFKDLITPNPAAYAELGDILMTVNNMTKEKASQILYSLSSQNPLTDRDYRIYQNSLNNLKTYLMSVEWKFLLKFCVKYLTAPEPSEDEI